MPEQLFLVDALYGVLNRSICIYFKHTVGLCVFMIYSYGQIITVTTFTNLLLRIVLVWF